MSDPFSHPVLSSVPREIRGKLIAYVDLLNEWQTKINLVSGNTLKDVWVRHVADSYQLLDFIEDKSAKIVDIGAGAGFPGLVLAIAGCSDVHLIESDTKKCMFLREVARVTQTKVTIHHGRAEETHIPNIILATSRACGNLSELLDILCSWKQKNVICLFHKGKTYTNELHEAGNWKFSHETFPSRIEDGGVILRITEIERCQK